MSLVKEICKSYLNALNKGDLDLVLSLFTSDAVVDSPLYGQMSAQKFYAKLFSDTNNSKTMLINILTSDNDNPSIALHFNYIWTLKSGKIVEFECVDVFELSLKKNKFSKLTIIYDTHHLRDDHLQSQQLNQE